MADPATIIKHEFKERLDKLQDMMATAPDFSCCLITLLVAKDNIATMIKVTADAITEANPELAAYAEQLMGKIR